MHVGIANPQWWGNRSRHSRRMRNPQFCISGKRPLNGECNVITHPCSNFDGDLFKRSLNYGWVITSHRNKGLDYLPIPNIYSMKATKFTTPSFLRQPNFPEMAFTTEGVVWIYSMNIVIYYNVYVPKWAVRREQLNNNWIYSPKIPFHVIMGQHGDYLARCLEELF